MRRVKSRSLAWQLGEVLEQFQSLRLALFGVKLGGKKVVSANRGDKRLVVVGCESDDLFSTRDTVIRVNEVEMRSLGQSRECGRRLGNMALIPPHVGDLVFGR